MKRQRTISDKTAVLGHGSTPANSRRMNAYSLSPFKVHDIPTSDDVKPPHKRSHATVWAEEAGVTSHSSVDDDDNDNDDSSSNNNSSSSLDNGQVNPTYDTHEYGQDQSADEHSDAIDVEAVTGDVEEPLNQHDGPQQGVVLSRVQRSYMLDDARSLGFWPWLEKYSLLHPADLFQVFDHDLPDNLRAASIDELLPALRDLFLKKASRRQKRQDINTIDDVVHLLDVSQNIMVLTGAGCSVSCGIPDFRSANGIYSRLDEFELDDPQQMFDIQYFRVRPETFYSFAKEIYPSNFKPSPSHMFIKLLEEKGKLLRNYTQNIDTLEKAAGISRVVQCHGSFATASCIVCGYSVPGTALEHDIFNKTVPRCPKCDEDHDGIMKPDIVFFGEKLPDEFDNLFQEDKDKVDLLVVMGSSLKVSPVADVKDRIPHDVPQILINMESLPHMQTFDVQLLGYCDTIVAELCRRLGWDLVHPQLPRLQNLPAHDVLDDGSQAAAKIMQGQVPHRHLFEGAIEASLGSDTEDDADSASDSDSSGSSSASSASSAASSSPSPLHALSPSAQ
ncbi:DHS-like NAD/FAD-binding domain-containing protein [Entophlyctis helioformis]|nr:DHS-like NAD/FAD-binding domain-containing protein [Entophlyctis helioformis]